MMLPFTTGLIRTTKFDSECSDLADGHYSRQSVGKLQFAPPGETMVLRDAFGDVLFVWCKQKYRADKEEGLNCTMFRNESGRLSSEIILEAEQLAFQRWGNIRAFTYVSPSKIRSTNPGFCFKCAGWNHVKTTDKGILLFEKALRALKSRDTNTS